MSMALTGERKISLAKAAEELRVTYKTVRRYVVELGLVPSVRRGVAANPDAKQGCKVFIDEHGLEKLRALLPTDVDEPAAPESPRSASTGSEPGLSGNP